MTSRQQYLKTYYQNNKERYNNKDYNRTYYLNNREKLIKKRKVYYQANKSSINKNTLKQTLRRNLRAALQLQNATKLISVMKLIGCTIEQLKQHLESKFYPHPETGEMMTWENHGFKGWHIDHIIPCKKFDLTNLEQQQSCFHWTNLQPLWWMHNLSKGAK